MNQVDKNKSAVGSGRIMATTPFVALATRTEEVTRTLALLSPALQGALHAGLYDYINHHKRKMLSRVGQTFVAGKRAIRMIASRTSGYAKWNEQPVRLGDMTAEAFIASRSGTDQPIDTESLLLFENGGQVSSTESFAVPFGAGLPRKSGPFQNVPLWNQAANKAKGGLRQFSFVKGKDGKVYIIDDRDSTVKRRKRAGEQVLAPVVGVLRRGRVQPKKLHFYETANEISDQHARKFDKLVAMAVTEAGRAELETRSRAAVETFRAGRDAFAAARDRGLSFSEARRAMSDARRAASAFHLGGEKGKV